LVFAGLLIEASVRIANKEKKVMRYVLLWALGVPISGLIVLHLLGMI